MKKIMQIISILSNIYERDINEFISVRGVYKSEGSCNNKCRAFRLLGYFCFEAFLNGETELTLRSIGKFIHQDKESIIKTHKYVLDRLRTNALTGDDVKTITRILEKWDESPKYF